MPDFDWNAFAQNGDFVTFKEIGDNVVGDIVAIRVGKGFNGDPVPEMIIRTDDGAERTLTAGQTMLKSTLADVRPQVGQRIAIVYSGVGNAKPGQAPAKLFDVAIVPAGTTPAPGTASPNTAAPSASELV